MRGTWAYQLELPAHADGKHRTPLRRRGFATLEEAETELDHARGLLALAPDPAVRRQITTLMLSVLKDTKSLPDTEEVRHAPLPVPLERRIALAGTDEGPGDACGTLIQLPRARKPR